MSLPDFRLQGMRGLAVVLFAVVLTGCASAPQRTTYDLSAAADIGRIAGSRAQIVVNTPTALSALDSDRILVRDQGVLSYLPDAQWSDPLPRLFQTRLIQTFENSSRLARVSRPGDRIVADIDRKSTRLNSSHSTLSRMPSSA